MAGYGGRYVSWMVLLGVVASVVAVSSEASRRVAPGGGQFVATEVYLIPHSHCDLGWLRTVDQYYTEYVRYSLTNVVAALLKNPNRTFIEAETGFFARWWGEQDDDMKATVKKLEASGQLEFVNGGWVMSDEAVTTFEGMVDQMTFGHRFLTEEVGVTPKVAWHIDPFGASTTTAAMLADMGYDAFVINRIDYELKQAWQQDKHLEFVWRGTPSRGTSADMFTHVLDSHYSAPIGFDYEYFTPASPSDLSGLANTNPPVFDKAPSAFTPANMKDRAALLAANVKQRAEYFMTPHVMVPFGDDFKYVNPEVQYSNMEKLIAYINDNLDTYKIRIRFATPAQYFQALHETPVSWPVFKHDLFPYAFAPDGSNHNQPGWASANSYWAGFYTSRPQLKGFSRSLEAAKHAEEMLVSAALASGAAANESALHTVRQVTALLKHHDAETGTSRPYVVQDYTYRVIAAKEMAGADAAASMSAMSSALAETEATPLSFSANASLLDAACKGSTVPVAVFNPLAWDREELISLPLSCANVTVYTVNADGAKAMLPAQVNPNISATFPYFPAAPNSAPDTPPPLAPPIPSKFTLYAQVSVPAIGFEVVYVSGAGGTPAPIGKVEWGIAPTSLSNGLVSLKFGPSGELAAMSSGNVSISVAQTFEVYSSQTQWPQSDVYIFRPDDSENTTDILAGAAKPLVGTTSGPLVNEVTQVYMAKTNATAFVQQTLRLVAPSKSSRDRGDAVLDSSTSVYMDMQIAMPGLNRELVSRFVTDLQTGASSPKQSPAMGAVQPTFYTDLNTQSVKHRMTNAPAWVTDVQGYMISEPVSASYYPTASAAFIADNATNPTRSAQFGMISDRSRGVGARNLGELEVMLHRRCHVTDQTLPLDDRTVIESRNRLFLGRSDDGSGAALHRMLVRSVKHPVSLFYGSTVAAPVRSPLSQLSLLSNALPLNLAVHSLDVVDPTASPLVLVLRLRHLFEVGQHPTLSGNVTVDVAQVLNPAIVNVSSVVETDLAAHASNALVGARHWRVAAGEAPTTRPTRDTRQEVGQVTISPLETRTFLVTIAKRSE